MVVLPSGTVTFLFTDIEGSTAHWERQHVAMGAALARHDALLRTAIREHGGYVIKTVGDAFHAAFARAPDAVAAALEPSDGSTSSRGAMLEPCESGWRSTLARPRSVMATTSGRRSIESPVC